MGNMILGYDFTDYTPTASTGATGYADDNLKLYSKPCRAWRSTVVTETTIVFDMSSAKALDAVVLVDVNFASAYLQGNATDSWGSPSFRHPTPSGNVTVSMDALTRRYNCLVTLTGFNYRYLRLVIPAQTPADGAGYFRIGSVVLLDTTLELTRNPDTGNAASADHACKTVETDGGGYDDIKLGDRMWQDTFRWKDYPRASISDIWTLNAQDRSEDLVWYYNMDDTSQAYVCRRRTAVEVSYTMPYNDTVAAITFRELR